MKLTIKHNKDLSISYTRTESHSNRFLNTRFPTWLIKYTYHIKKLIFESRMVWFLDLGHDQWKFIELFRINFLRMSEIGTFFLLSEIERNVKVPEIYVKFLFSKNYLTSLEIFWSHVINMIILWHTPFEHTVHWGILLSQNSILHVLEFSNK